MKIKDAIKKLNAMDELGDKIEIKGLSEKELEEAFMEAVESIDSDVLETKENEDIVEFYNALVDRAEAPAKAPAKPEKKAPEKKAPEKPEKKAPAKPEKKAPAKPEKKAPAKSEKKAPAKPEKKAPEKKGEGVIASILSIIKEFQPITKENIIKKLAKQFPDRDEAGMAKTVQLQIGGKGETRMEKEKGIKLKKSSNGEISLGRK